MGAEDVVVAGSIEISEQDDRQYRHITLPNGLQALLIHDPEADKGAAALNVRVGSLADPPFAFGLAHFLEHMLFLGTAKYPDESEYSAYLNAHGGYSNAWTAMENTNYLFDVNQEHLEGALDRFADFFVAPLFTDSCTAREMNAVDNENSKNLQDDGWRTMQLYKGMASKKHPLSQFSTGNLQTLRDNPQAAGVDIRSELLKFHQKYYSSNIMKLVVVGKQDLDTLTRYVQDRFLAVKDLGIKAPVYDEVPAFSPQELKKRLHAVPVKDLRQVQVAWPLPSLYPHYRSKPARYLSHLIGHEGAGSLLSLLKEKGWANELSAGAHYDRFDGSFFMVSVDCTDLGMKHADDIVTCIYQYIALLREKGPQEWIFNEGRDLALMNFRFISKARPLQYASRLASNMHLFPPELTVSGERLFWDYKPELIEEVMGAMVPDNMLMLLLSRDFEGKTDLTDQWYGTEYSLTDIDASLLSQWADPGVHPSLRLPDPNPMIATDFSLKPKPEGIVQQEQQAQDRPEVEGPPSAGTGVGAPPVLLRDDPDCRLWYKHDSVFLKPKLNIKADLVTPVAYESPESCVLTDMAVRMLQEDLNEYSYMAGEAGLHAGLNLAREGLNMEVEGYNHKLGVFLQKVVEIVAGFGASLGGGQARQDLFNRVKERMTKEYKNLAFVQSYQHAMFNTCYCLELPKWTYTDKIAVAEGPAITLETLQAFVPRLLGQFYTEALVHGNATAAEAAALIDQVLQGMPHRTVAPALRPEARVVQLKDNTRYLHVASSPNPEEPCSAIEVTYQIGMETMPVRARLEVLAHVMKDRAFDQLRTKEQLGYLVWCGKSEAANYVLGLRFIVMSNAHDPAHIEDRIEAFVQLFEQELSSMSAEEYGKNQQAVVEQILEKDKNLGEETHRHWKQVSSKAYDFAKAQKTAAAVKALTRDELVGFFKEHLSASSSTRRKLSCQIWATQHPSGGKPATDLAAPANPSEGEDTGAAAPSEQAALPPVPATSESTVAVGAFSEFKRTMPLFPLRPSSLGLTVAKM